jgi:hypothetical protein
VSSLKARTRAHTTAVQPFENPQENGKRYLVYKNDEDGQMYTKKTQLWIQPLTEDGLRFVSACCGVVFD